MESVDRSRVGRPWAATTDSTRDTSGLPISPEPPRQPRGGAEADRHGLAVEVGAVARHLLDRMPEGVAKVQERAAALVGLLPLVGLDEAGLDAAADAHGPREPEVARRERRALEVLEEQAVARGGPS